MHQYYIDLHQIGDTRTLRRRCERTYLQPEEPHSIPPVGRQSPESKYALMSPWKGLKVRSFHINTPG